MAIEASKSYEQLEWETKQSRRAAERAAAERWRPQPPTRNPAEDVLGPEVMNNLPGLRPRSTFDPLCPPTSKIER
jgi:hypothetical protein